MSVRFYALRYHIPDNHCTPLYQVLAATGCDKTAGATALLVVRWAGGLGVEEQLQSQDKQKLEDAGLP
ncbi:hypothetical protein DPX16_14499 [Anabarilius grahami]|uniref:Uncharacterized protein n=1 Tax=Anabarilius grahami TaxID=495550 RepID=A0A3N0YZ64_ANAGA|nr:hypothetical protein DPX16_14499 [Anabarilius grahami]